MDSAKMIEIAMTETKIHVQDLLDQSVAPTAIATALALHHIEISLAAFKGNKAALREWHDILFAEIRE